MNRKTLVTILIVVVVLIGAVAYLILKNKTVSPATSNTENNSSDQNTNITYLISNEDGTKYCNGADMDSEGYRKTITTEVVSNIPKTDLSEAELAKETAVLAITDGICKEVIQQLDFSVAGGVVKIPPIEGWAGVSIALCTCRPQVEVNLLRIPGITQVDWSSN